ncbi:hypothetical protein J14TS5_40870 [Paenibacillus lautus]|uniref:DUF2306 domain-containing protein n=1 Tax=Paenibacillus lautus TaxID=1401 RepID=UPI001B0FD2FE|nr:DUF2306 domain-containing protein [Paenibacillus lautus]GIO99001.1 hypothetical protein J14TS5_40870 [Paenibacillus lautus]
MSAWLDVMYVHVIFACIAMIGGAMNFSNTMLQMFQRFHWLNGYVYIVSVMVVVFLIAEIVVRSVLRDSAR